MRRVRQRSCWQPTWHPALWGMREVCLGIYYIRTEFAHHFKPCFKGLELDLDFKDILSTFGACNSALFAEREPHVHSFQAQSVTQASRQTDFLNPPKRSLFHSLCWYHLIPTCWSSFRDTSSLCKHTLLAGKCNKSGTACRRPWSLMASLSNGSSRWWAQLKYKLQVFQVLSGLGLALLLFLRVRIMWIMRWEPFRCFKRGADPFIPSLNSASILLTYADRCREQRLATQPLSSWWGKKRLTLQEVREREMRKQSELEKDSSWRVFNVHIYIYDYICTVYTIYIMYYALCMYPDSTCTKQ